MDGASAARFREIDYVVVNQRGRVDHFDDGGHTDQCSLDSPRSLPDSSTRIGRRRLPPPDCRY